MANRFLLLTTLLVGHTPVAAEICRHPSIQGNPVFQNYREDCEDRLRFNEVRGKYIAKEIDIHNISLYRGLRLIDRDSYEISKLENQKIWNVYDTPSFSSAVPSFFVWVRFELSNFALDELVKKR